MPTLNWKNTDEIEKCQTGYTINTTQQTEEREMEEGIDCISMRIFTEKVRVKVERESWLMYRQLKQDSEAGL